MNKLGYALLLCALCITSFFLGESCCHKRLQTKIELAKANLEKAKILVKGLEEITEHKLRHTRKKQP
jgi:hypothetical protein